jgi:hypothetical protein
LSFILCKYWIIRSRHCAKRRPRGNERRAHRHLFQPDFGTPAPESHNSRQIHHGTMVTYVTVSFSSLHSKPLNEMLNNPVLCPLISMKSTQSHPDYSIINVRHKSSMTIHYIMQYSTPYFHQVLIGRLTGNRLRTIYERHVRLPMLDKRNV